MERRQHYCVHNEMGAHDCRRSAREVRTYSCLMLVRVVRSGMVPLMAEWRMTLWRERR